MKSTLPVVAILFITVTFAPVSLCQPTYGYNQHSYPLYGGQAPYSDSQSNQGPQPPLYRPPLYNPPLNQGPQPPLYRPPLYNPPLNQDPQPPLYQNPPNYNANQNKNSDDALVKMIALLAGNPQTTNIANSVLKLHESGFFTPERLNTYQHLITAGLNIANNFLDNLSKAHARP